jgi:hypothetical protein
MKLSTLQANEEKLLKQPDSGWLLRVLKQTAAGWLLQKKKLLKGTFKMQNKLQETENCAKLTVPNYKNDMRESRAH